MTDSSIEKFAQEGNKLNLEKKRAEAQKRAAESEINNILINKEQIEQQLKAVEQQLHHILERHIPDTQPYVSFKPAKDINDFISSLKVPPRPLRVVLQEDIAELRKILTQFDSELQRARQQSALAKKRAQGNASALRYHEIGQKMQKLFEKWKTTGEEPKDEIAEVLGAAEKELEERITNLNSDPSNENIKSVLTVMKDLAVMGRDTEKAWGPLRKAAGQRVDQSVTKLRNNPTPKNVKEVLDNGRIAGLFGNDSAAENSMGASLNAAVKLTREAERKFRSMPTVRNYEALFEARRGEALLGGRSEPALPLGFRDKPRGETYKVDESHMTLDRISKRFFGSSKYWDVLAWRNSTINYKLPVLVGIEVYIGEPP